MQQAEESLLGPETQGSNVDHQKSVLWSDESNFEIFCSSPAGTCDLIRFTLACIFQQDNDLKHAFQAVSGLSDQGGE